MKVFPVPTDDLVDWWERVSPMLKQVADESDGRYTLRHLAEGCGNGDFQMWAVTDDEEVKATALTRMIVYPTGQRRGEVIIATGRDLGAWVEKIPEFKQQFIEMFNLDRVGALARPGWSRKLKDWRMTHVYLEAA